MAEFVIHVPDVDSEGKHYSFRLEPSWMASALDKTDLRADPSADPSAMELKAQRQGDDILVFGKIETRIFADCIRCLEDAPVDVGVDVGALFTAKSDEHRPETDELEMTPEELARETYSGDDIVLDELVRETVILEVPMQPLCREDCPGIEVPEHVRPPADFGETKDADGVDPRLRGLKDIAKQMFSKEE